MGVFETFSKRQRKLEQAGRPGVYQYDVLSTVFRRQVIYIWASAIGPYVVFEDNGPLNMLRNPLPASNSIWLRIFNTLTRELGVFELGDKNADPFVQCRQYILSTDTGGALDIIDLSFYVIDQDVRRLSLDEVRYSNITQPPDDAIEELNKRFRENGIGYQFENGELVKMDPQFVHEQLVRPVITLPTFRSLIDRFC